MHQLTVQERLLALVGLLRLCLCENLSEKRRVTCKTPSLKKKKEVLNQQGGFLPALASLIAPFALDLLGKVLK